MGEMFRREYLRIRRANPQCRAIDAYKYLKAFGAVFPWLYTPFEYNKI